MRPVQTREEYMALRNGGRQAATMKAVREGDEQQKRQLVQMNYSCLPNEDGTLKGSKRMSTTIGMDVDWTPLRIDELGIFKVRYRRNEMSLLFLIDPKIPEELNKRTIRIDQVVKINGRIVKFGGRMDTPRNLLHD